MNCQIVNLAYLKINIIMNVYYEKLIIYSSKFYIDISIIISN